jgi:hypothetical protein
MDKTIDLPITHNGKQLSFPARLVRFGYSYRIEVDINETIITFERDEERNWRALINPETGNPKVDTDLINSIIQVLDSL